MSNITLPSYLARVAPRPFEFGVTDCARFAAGWIGAATGREPGADTLYSAADVADVIRRAGGLRALGRRFGDDVGLIETDRVREGDVAVVLLPDGGTVFAIATRPGGDEWAVKTTSGLYIGPAKPLRCWTFQGGGAAGAEAVGLFLLTSVGVGNFTLFGGVTLAHVLGTLVVTTLSLGAQYALSSLLAPKGRDPGQQQQTVKSSIASRVVHYGRTMTGGVLVFSHAVNGWWYNVIAMGVGPISFVELYLNDKLVTAPVRPGPALGAYYDNVWLDLRTGLARETAYQMVKTAFPFNWTDDHRGDGIASAMVAYRNPGQKRFATVYQGGIPSFRALIDGVQVYDPRDGAGKHSANAALCILDYLRRLEGYAFPLDRLDLASFAAFANICDERVPLKAGGAEPRYTLNGSIEATEPRKAALKRMLDTCDGRIYLTAEGRIAIRGGKYLAPEMSVTSGDLVARSYDLILPDATDRANVLKPVFTSPQHDYQSTEAAAWRDEARVAREGEVVEPLDLKLVTSHTQGQRLAKIAAHRINAVPRGQLRCRFGAIGTYEQPGVQLVDPALGINSPFELANWSLEISDSSLAVSMEGACIGPEGWEWDAAVDERPAPTVPSTVLETGIPEPENIVVFATAAAVGQVAFRLEFDPPEVDTLYPDAQQSLHDAATWTGVVGEEGESIVTLPVVTENDAEWDIQARLRSFVIGAWTEIVTVPATTFPDAPDDLVSASVTGAKESCTVALTPGLGTFAVRIYANTALDFPTATRRMTREVEPGTAVTFTVDDLDPGSVHVFVEPLNPSAVAGTVETFVVTIT